MAQHPRITALCALAALPAAAGCLSLGHTQSAQTLERGDVQHQFGLEWFRVRSTDEDYLLPFAMPFYGVRLGVSEGVDLGVRTNVTFSAIDLDVKMQPVDTETLDVAVDPRVEYGWTWGVGHLPLLIGINLGDAVQLTLSGRLAYALPLIEDSPGGLEAVVGDDAQALAGGGASLYVRFSRSFALVPEAQAVRGFGETDPTIMSFSLGFAFGDQPGTRPEPEEPPAPPTRHAPIVPARPEPEPEPGGMPAPYGAPGGRPTGAAPPAGASPTTPPGYGPPAPEPAPGEGSGAGGDGDVPGDPQDAPAGETEDAPGGESEDAPGSPEARQTERHPARR